MVSANLSYVISAIWFVLWIAALVDCLTGSSRNKVAWVLVIILLPILGSLIYFLVNRARPGL